MMLMQLREKVRNRAGISSGDQYIPSQVLDDAINQAILQIDGEYHWPWLEATQTISLVDGTDTYALPADYRATRSMVALNTDSSNSVLPQVSPTQALSKVTTDVGFPMGYALYEGNIVLLPTPGAGYTLKHLYYRQSTELVNDTDEPLIPDLWHPAVVAAAAGNIAMREELRGIKDACDVDVANWIRKMRNALRRSTGPVVPRIRKDGWM